LSVVYLAALLGVGVSILWLLVEAVLSVSRKPRWESQTFRTLTLVTPTDRRTRDLPFVGAERRQAAAEADEEADRKAA
jgi:hypothetical protein